MFDTVNTVCGQSNRYCPECKRDENEVVKAGEKLKESKKKSRMASASSSSSRDWGKVHRSGFSADLPPGGLAEQKYSSFSSFAALSLWFFILCLSVVSGFCKWTCLW